MKYLHECAYKIQKEETEKFMSFQTDEYVKLHYQLVMFISKLFSGELNTQ